MSPLVIPPFAALANDGIRASSADAPTRAPAPVAAVRVRNCLRSDRPVVPSCSFSMLRDPPRSSRCHASIRGGRAVGSIAPKPNLATAVSRFVSIPSMRDFLRATRERVLVYDGGMGATLEQFDLSLERDYKLPGR